jgi:Uma2 family endonuclease
VQRDEHLDAVGPAPDHRVAARETEPGEAVRQPVGPGLELGEREPLPLGVEHRERVGHQRGLGGEGVGSGHDPTLARPVDNSRDLSAPRATLDAMTALPDFLRPLTVAKYAALPEYPDRDYELQDGHVVMSAKPIPDHQHAVFELGVQLRSQVPEHLKLLLEVDVDMDLVPPTQPGTVRAPDLVVVTHEAFLRVRHEGGFLRAAECVLAIEVHSTTARRTDQVIKHGEYADAGIGHYWMVDLLGGPALTACHLGGAFGYVDEPPVTSTFTTQHPFPARLDLAALV